MAMRMMAIFTVATVLFDDQNAARRTSVISDEQQKFDVRKVIRIGYFPRLIKNRRGRLDENAPSGPPHRRTAKCRVLPGGPIRPVKKTGP